MPATLECETVVSDLVLQAARQAIPANASNPFTADCGRLNQPLMPLLVGLIDAAKTVSSAISDNAWDSGHAIPGTVALDLIGELKTIQLLIQSAADAQS